jgi:type IV secretory pathway VirB2 component (pilin)
MYTIFFTGVLMKKKQWLAATFAAAAFPLTAQALLPSGMTNLMESILEIFTGPFVRAILVIFLCCTAITYGFNKDNDKMKRNCIAIGVAIAVLIGASGIVEAVWNASQ